MLVLPSLPPPVQPLRRHLEFEITSDGFAFPSTKDKAALMARSDWVPILSVLWYLYRAMSSAGLLAGWDPAPRPSVVALCVHTVLVPCAWCTQETTTVSLTVCLFLKLLCQSLVFYVSFRDILPFFNC